MFRLMVFFMGLLTASSVFSKQHHTIGSVAETLVSGTDIITKLVLFMCFIVGVSLIIISLFLFQSHRHNPKLVPLDKPLLYVFLGLVAIAIPFLGHFIAPTGSTIDIKKAEVHRKGLQLQDIDAPLEWGQDFDH